MKKPKLPKVKKPNFKKMAKTVKKLLGPPKKQGDTGASKAIKDESKKVDSRAKRRQKKIAKSLSS